jgi:hypothetical protein
MAKNKGKKTSKGSQPPNRARSNRSGLGAIASSQNVRTVNVLAVHHGLIACNETVEDHHIIGSAAFPALKAHLDHCQEWRIRSARVTVDSLAAETASHLVGVLVEPKTWKPVDWAQLKSMGGVIKSCRSQGWSSNTIPGQDDWVKFDARAATIYTACPGAANPADSNVMLTVHAQIQMRGFR